MKGRARIRPMRLAEDFESILHLDRYINGKRKRAEVYGELEAYAGRIYVAEIDGRVVGFISLSRPFWNHIGMVDHLAVEEDCRGQGIGRALLERVIKEARRRRIRFLCVQTALWNTGAIDFYRSAGFRACAVFPDYLGDGNDMIWLEKDLRRPQ